MSIASVVRRGYSDTIAAVVWRGFSPSASTAPTILTTSLPSGTVGVGYTATLAADGSVTITWAVTVGVLPDGLSLSAAGVFSGVPTGVESQTFTVTATNDGGNDTQVLTIGVGTASAGTGVDRAVRGLRMGRGLLRLVGR